VGELERVVGTAIPALRELAMVLEEAASEQPASGGLPLAVSFRLPLGNLDRRWYEGTRRYGPYNYHPERCEDWNLESGGNTDVGEPVVAPFAGLVTSARTWGASVGRAVQLLGLTPAGEVVVWVGWHLQRSDVAAGAIVRMGDPVGAIGNADGYYAGAHLHEQICLLNELGVPSSGLFAGADGRYRWQQPSRFYVERGVDAELVQRCAGWRE